MKNNEKNRNTDAWSIPLGTIIGLGISIYIKSLKGNHDEMIAFPLIFFPMLGTLGIAAIAHLVFWSVTGHMPRKHFSHTKSNAELLSEAAKSNTQRRLAKAYRHLQVATMAGAGYIVTCPIIAIVISK